MENTELRATTQGDKRGLDAYVLKLIAIFGMTLDHAAVVFVNYLPLWAESALYALGGLTFPIMAYLLCEGYRHTRSVPKYALRLLGFAALTQIPYMWALTSQMHAFQLNVLFTLLLCLVALVLMERIKSPFLSALAVFGLTVVSLFFDWGLMAIPMVLIYNYTSDKKMKVILPIFIPLLLTFLQVAQMLGTGGPEGLRQMLPQILFIVVGCVLTIPLLGRYNGQRGKSAKYLFYLYYPLHLVVLALIRGLVFGNWASLF